MWLLTRHRSLHARYTHGSSRRRRSWRSSTAPHSSRQRSSRRRWPKSQTAAPSGRHHPRSRRRSRPLGSATSSGQRGSRPRRRATTCRQHRPLPQWSSATAASRRHPGAHRNLRTRRSSTTTSRHRRRDSKGPPWTILGKLRSSPAASNPRMQRRWQLKAIRNTIGRSHARAIGIGIHRGRVSLGFIPS